MRSTALFLLLALAPQLLAEDLEDLTPPVLDAISLDTQFVDVTNDDAIIVMTVEASDDVSGLESMTISMRSPNEDRSFSFDSFSNAKLISGTPRDGVWQKEVTIPRNLEPGTWDFRLNLFDQANRITQTSYGVASFTAVNNGLVDTQRPTIHNITVTPSTLDMSVSNTVQVDIDLSDDASGIRVFYYRFEAPSGGSSNNFGDAPRSVFPPDPARKIYTVHYTFPASVEEGVHTFVIPQMYDRVVRFNAASGGTYPYPVGSSPSVTITNPNADSTPPELTGFQITTGTADVTYGPQEVECTLDFEDPISGLRFASVTFQSPSGKDSSFRLSLSPENLESGTINSGRLRGTFTVPFASEPGTWTPRIYLSDVGWYGVAYGDADDDRPLPGGASNLVVSNSGPVDSEDAQVTSLSVNPNPVDVSSGPQIFDLTVGFTDDASGVERLFITLESPGGEERIFELVRALVPNTGTITNGTVTIPIEIPGYTYAGDWTIEVSIYDRSGNYNGYNDPEDYPVGVLNYFTVVNTTGVDLDPPALVSLEFLSNEVDITDGEARFDFRAVVTDNLSGFDFGRIELISPTGASPDQSVGFYDDAIDPSGAADNYFEDFLIDPFIEPGLWKVLVYLRDINGNTIELGEGGDGPLPPGVPTEFLIRNTGPIDATPPVVSNISITPDAFNVTDAPGYLRLEFDVSDDVSGFSERRGAELRVQNSDTFNAFYFVVGPEHRISGTALNGSYSILIELPRFMEPGTWINRLTVWDNADRRTQIKSFPVGIPNELTVINTGPSDTTDPQLTGLTLPTAPINLTDGYQRIPISLQFSDDYAGISHLSFSMRGPDGITQPSITLYPEDLAFGDQNGGQFNFEYGLPQFAPAGEWTARVALYENAGNDGFFGFSSPIPNGLPSFVTVVNTNPASPYFEFLRNYRNAIPYERQGYLDNWDGDPFPNILEAAFGLNPTMNSLPGGDDPNADRAPVARFEESKVVIEFTPSALTMPGGQGSPLQLIGRSSTTIGDPRAAAVTPQYLGDGRYSVEMPIDNGTGFLWLEVSDPNLAE